MGLKATNSNRGLESLQVLCGAAGGSELVLALLGVFTAVASRIKIFDGNGRYDADFIHFFHFPSWMLKLRNQHLTKS